MSWRQLLLAFGAYSAIFLLLYLPFLLSDSVAFTCDGFIYTALANHWANQVISFFSGGPVTNFLYPETSPTAFGEFSLGHSILFSGLKIFLRTDVITSFFYISMVYATNAFATMLFAFYYTREELSAWFAGFVFAFSNFMFANNDDYYVFTLAPAILSLYLTNRFYAEGRLSQAIWAGVLGGLQIFFSAQSFVYLLFASTILHCFKIRQLWQRKHGVLLLLGCGLTVSVPVFLMHLNHHLNYYPINAWGSAEGLFARVEHFFYPLPDSLMAGVLNLEPMRLTWMTIKLHMFSGFMYLLLAALAFKKFSWSKIMLLVLAGWAALFALGLKIHAFGSKFSSPVEWFYDLIPLAEYLRVAWRSYFFATFAFAVLAAMGLKMLFEKFSKQRILLFAAAILIHSLENVSLPPNGVYEKTAYPHLPAAYSAYFKDKPRAVIFDLPSNAISVPEYFDEAIYMLYQTEHRRNILGGVNGYYPASRLLHQKYLYRMPEEKSIEYFEHQGLTHFVYHKKFKHKRSHLSLDFFYFDLERERKKLNKRGASYNELLIDSRSFIEEYDWLQRSKAVKKVFEDKEIIIYEFSADQ